jgi:hypothetical protein
MLEMLVEKVWHGSVSAFLSDQNYKEESHPMDYPFQIRKK